MNLFSELKRRNVFRVGIAYGVAAWLLIQVSDTVFPRIGLSESAVTLVIALLGIGLIPALIFAWVYEMTPEGLKRERDVDRAQSITVQTGKKVDRALLPGNCAQTNWTLEFATPLGRAQQVLEKVREQLRCDPLDDIANYMLAYVQLWLGDPDAAIRTAEDAMARGITFSWLEEMVYIALLARGDPDDPRVLNAGDRPSSWISFPQDILRLSLLGDTAAARELAESYWASPDADDWAGLTVAAVLGDRQRANEFAARIDARPGSALVLNGTSYGCLCGAPFDLEATPNYRARIEEAGFPWPPASPIKYPAKDW